MVRAMQDDGKWCKLSDAELVRRAQAGERAALGVLVRRHQQRIYNVARHLADPSIAEDVTRAVVESMCRDIGQLRDPTSFVSWLISITFNLCMLELRKRYRQERAEMLAVETSDRVQDSVFESVAERLRGELLERELVRLPHWQHTAIVLYYYEGLSYKEISKATNRPLNTVRSDLHRGLRTLKKHLLHDPSLVGGDSQ